MAALREVEAGAPGLAEVLALHGALMLRLALVTDMPAAPRPGRHFVLAEGDRVLAAGVLRPVASGHVELSAMHVLPEARGRGLGMRLLAGLLAAARAGGAGRASLWTGSMDEMEPARRLYEAAGFGRCEPFGAHVPDPRRVFYTRAL
jgi:putative acetyltransferase